MYLYNRDGASLDHPVNRNVWRGGGGGNLLDADCDESISTGPEKLWLFCASSRRPSYYFRNGLSASLLVRSCWFDSCVACGPLLTGPSHAVCLQPHNPSKDSSHLGSSGDKNTQIGSCDDSFTIDWCLGSEMAEMIDHYSLWQTITASATVWPALAHPNEHDLRARSVRVERLYSLSTQLSAGYPRVCCLWNQRLVFPSPNALSSVMIPVGCMPDGPN